MQKMKQIIEEYMMRLDAESRQMIQIMGDEETYPFNKYEFIFHLLFSKHIITETEYLKIRRQYIQRNQYLYLFDMAPRTFGQNWGEEHIRELIPELVKPSRINHPDFDGEYDLLYGNTKIEVKATRASKKKGGGGLASRALSFQDVEDLNYKFHFEQLKPSCCDVFIWIGVMKDSIVYAVLSAEECRDLKGFGTQHRNENTGSPLDSVYEGQIFISYQDLKSFLVPKERLLKKIIEKGR